MIRILLFFIPIFTFIIPMRWFSFYAMLMIAGALYVVLMFTALTEETASAFASFGIEFTAGYIGINLVLLAVRYALIRRARARIPNLPAPKK